ncbi:MAG: heat shock protein HspQ [Thermoanaerobaculia bacterium]
MSEERRARFEMGQVVDHQLFGYRGVIYNVDPTFQQSEEWYETVARSRPPKDRPWYHVLPDGAADTTYVAERNLEPATEPTPVHHPLVEEIFESFDGTRYRLRRGVH